MRKFLYFLIGILFLLIFLNFFPPLRAQEEIDYSLLKKKIDTLLSKQDEIIKRLDNISKEVRKIKIRVSRIRR